MVDTIRQPRFRVALTCMALIAALVSTSAPARADTIDSEPFVTSFYKWGQQFPGTGALVTWSLLGAGNSLESGKISEDFDSIMPAGYLDEFVKAFDAWSAVANIMFFQVASGGDIRLAMEPIDGTGATLAHAFFPPPPHAPFALAGDVHFDSADNWKIGFGGPGFDIFQVAVHEIGHAIGIQHTAVPGSLMNPNYTEAFSGPQADDIAAAQFLYGPNPACMDPDSEGLYSCANEGPVTAPEPSTIFLFGVALVGFLGVRSRLTVLA